MHKREIKYTNFDDQPQTMTAHFNLTKSELVQMTAEMSGGLQGLIRRVGAGENRGAIITEFKELILSAYGVREGERFIKNDEVRAAFEQTMAFDALFMELMTDEDALVTFIIGICPKDLMSGIDKDTLLKAGSGQMSPDEILAQAQKNAALPAPTPPGI